MPLTDVAARLGAMAYAAWGLWALGVLHGAGTGPLYPGTAHGAYLMTFIALQAIGVSLMLNWRNSGAGFALNAIAVTWAQLGTCVLTPYAWLPAGFVGPLLWAIALVASGSALLLAPKHPRLPMPRLPHEMMER